MTAPVAGSYWLNIQALGGTANLTVDGKSLTTVGGGFTPDPTCITTYSEGLNIGYRYFDATGETPPYPFGYGLSYTSFRYANLQSSAAADGGLNVSFDVTNTGSASGADAPQVYLEAPKTIPTGVAFAPKALAAYGRVYLTAGQTKTVALHVPVRQLQYWSDAAGWTTATGTRSVDIGPSERTTALTAAVMISGNPTVNGKVVK